MSFGFNPLGNNPLHAMMPLMGNLPNGANFMTSLAAGIPPMAGPSHTVMANLSAVSDSALDFKKNQGQAPGAAPMDLETNEPECRAGQKDKADIAERRSSEGSSNGLEEKNLGPMSLPQSEMVFNGMMGMPQGFMMMPGMMNVIDPSMLGLQQFPIVGAPHPLLADGKSSSAGAGVSTSAKEVITCKSCTLFPPNPNTPAPTTRERPPGCRTVFVGGLPENIGEEIIREVFERCGEITTLRLSKKNFCHIRFAFEASVDSAIYLSGYRLRITGQTDLAHSGRLHVDYAQARDDQYEWECRQRQLQREQRHRERLERDRLRPLSPPPIVHYTEHEAAAIAERLKQDESFAKAVQTLIAWLERGDCNKRNSNTFYSMIQSTNAHVRRISGEKLAYEEELQKARELYRKQTQSMMVQFTQIKKVFNAASHKKVWDHFTKAQRKNIDLWKRQALEIATTPLEDLHDEDEMEMSDEERESSLKSASKKAKLDNDSLKEENDSLRCQLEVYKNEVNLVKSDLKSDTDIKDQQIKVLQETIRNMQTQLLENKSREKEKDSKIVDLEAKLKAANVKELLLKTKIATKSSTSATKCSSTESEDTENFDEVEVKSAKAETINEYPKMIKIDPEEARIIGLVSTFLVVHPFGASTDYIWSYVHRVAPHLRPKGLEELLSRYTNIFVEQVTGVGAKIERNWRFSGFDE
ncbi:ecto-NOX disulfide-thiol exchanger 2 [Phlebotomus argentipes]|uniref:ecto-NOX disulfide-thiol exchanger 2 n=1 Tax=Phlebotomus argentipes TaxID=94469 RepID=UPI0028935777|nr:ecto-NOX disulfide-thiol exchanger 2 [Phlebotomus argentipes]